MVLQCIAQDDVLNMVIALALILIPSNMIILKKKIIGYNNVLTMATSEMSFGVNEDINYIEPVVKPEKKVAEQNFFSTTYNERNLYLLSSAGNVKPYYSIFSIINKFVLPAVNNTN